MEEIASMESKVVRISARQFFLVVLMFISGSSILLVPPGVIAAAKQDAWISSAIGSVLGVGLCLLYIKLGNMHPKKTLFEFSDFLFGKLLGRAVNTLYVFFAFLLAAFVLSNVGDFMTTQVMVEVPKKYIQLLFLLPVLYAVILGLETIVRSMEAIFPALLMIFFALLLLLLPQIETMEILPIFGEGIKPILQGSLVVLNLPYLELVLLLAVFPYLNSKKGGKAFWIGGAIGGLSLVLYPLLIVMILGKYFAGMLLYPSYSLAKMVELDFLRRIEVLYAAIWISTLFYKLVICFFVSLEGINHLLAIEDRKILAFPLVLILWGLSIIVYPNYAVYQLVIQSILSYKLLFGLLLPAIMIVLSVIKAKMKQQASPSQ